MPEVVGGVPQEGATVVEESKTVVDVVDCVAEAVVQEAINILVEETIKSFVRWNSVVVKEATIECRGI